MSFDVNNNIDDISSRLISFCNFLAIWAHHCQKQKISAPPTMPVSFHAFSDS